MTSAPAVCLARSRDPHSRDRIDCKYVLCSFANPLVPLRRDVSLESTGTVTQARNGLLQGMR